MKVLAVVFLLLVPCVCWGYGYQSINCACGSQYASQPVDVTLGLVNSGGMNIFYFCTDGDQVTQNLYSNVNKKVILSGVTDVSGNIVVDVSTNYNNNFALSCLACGPTYKETFWNTLWFTGLMGLAGCMVGGLLWWSIQAAHLS